MDPASTPPRQSAPTNRTETGPNPGGSTGSVTPTTFNERLASLLVRKRWLAPSQSSRTRRALIVSANVVGAAGAAFFAWSGLQHYESTHSLVGAGFFVGQLWVVIAYLARRPAAVVSQRTGDWLLAFGGTFGGVLLRPSGIHPHWGVTAGLWLQVVGLAFLITSYLFLGRSFGFAAADRGLKRRGPYAVVRHPVYASYVLLLLGYLLQSISVWNGIVVAFVCACNAGRALVEERLLASSTTYDEYRRKVRWRLIPGLW